MTTNNKTDGTFSFGFLDEGAKVRLEMMNISDETLKSVEILTVFLKDEETPGGGPSRVHISFETLNSIRSKEKSIMTHKTWIDGKPVAADGDHLERLKAREGEVKPYVLDISWQDPEGKTRFQRIPIGH